MKEERITELDSVRGIAAFTVLIHHCLLVIPVVFNFYFSHDVHNAPYFMRFLIFSPFHIFWNGHAAVILFFILSGFVLSISYYDHSRYNYMGYVVKRFIRLYIPYFVIITISVLLLDYDHNNNGIDSFSIWFNKMWSKKIGLADYCSLLFFKGDYHNVCTTLWTIVVEIKISLILPFFYMLIKRMSFVQNIIFALVYTALYQVLVLKNVVEHIPALRDFYYLPFFLFGGIIYKYRQEVRASKLMSAAVLYFLCFVIVILYNWEWIFPWFRKGTDHYIYRFINDYMVGISSCLLIMICILNVAAVKKALNHSVFAFLGRISYSLYLIHPIILLFAVYHFRSVQYGYIACIVIVSGVLLSYIYYLLVEKPSINLGRYLGSFVKKR